MTRRNPVRQLLPILLIAGAAAFPAAAEDVEKKFRLGATIGFFNPQDSVKSDAGNTLTLVNDALLFEEFYIDPRNDSAVFGALDLNPAFSGTIYGQYALTKVLILEASVGYAKQDVGDVELQVQFDQNPVPVYQPFLFDIYRFKVGEVERIPVQLTALARFRPRSSFNPYVGLGVGYTYNGFTPDPGFDDLSRRIDGSFGALARVTDATTGNPTLISPGESAARDLQGAVVSVRDTFEWHTAYGFEYSFKRKWALMFDARWTLSSRTLQVGFNGGTDLGVAVPERVDFIDSEAATTSYGGMRIFTGGLIDGGVLVPGEGANPGHDCNVDPSRCTFDTTQRDGIPDPGIYYVQGGEFDYGGVSFEIGMRYTF